MSEAGYRGMRAGMEPILDDIDPASKTGWSVMIQGGAHHVEDEDRRAELLQAGIESWAPLGAPSRVACPGECRI